MVEERISKELGYDFDTFTAFLAKFKPKDQVVLRKLLDSPVTKYKAAYQYLFLGIYLFQYLGCPIIRSQELRDFMEYLKLRDPALISGITLNPKYRGEGDSICQNVGNVGYLLTQLAFMLFKVRFDGTKNIPFKFVDAARIIAKQSSSICNRKNLKPPTRKTLKLSLSTVALVGVIKVCVCILLCS